MGDELKISVIICSYNRADYIIGAIESLYHQTLDKNLYEVFVVDNNSKDNTKSLCLEYIQQHKDYNIHYIEEHQQGASFARNKGAAKASSPLLCFMDDDAIANNDYLEKIVNFFETHKDAGGLGGRIIPKYIPEEPKWMSHYVSSLVGNFHYSDTVEIFKPGKYPLESNMVVFKKDFDTVGGFNILQPGVVGTLRIGGEGKELFYKLQAMGRNIYYDPSIKVEHIVEVKKLTPEYMYRVASGQGRGERVRVLQISKGAFIKKNIEYCFKLGAAFVLGMKYALQGKPSKSWPVIQFKIDAWKGLIGK